MIRLSRHRYRSRGRVAWLAVLFASTVFLVLGSVPAVAAPNLYDITDPLSTATDPGPGGSEDLCALVAVPPGADVDASPLGVPGTPSGYDGRLRTYCHEAAPATSESGSAVESAGPVSCDEVPVVEEDRCEAWVGLYDPAPSVSDEAGFGWEFPTGGIALDEGNGRIYQTGYNLDWCASAPGRVMCPKFATVAYDTDGNRVWAARYDGLGDLAQPFDVEVSPDGERVYVAGLVHNLGRKWELVVVAYDAQTGAQLWESIDDDPSRQSVGFHMALSPDGDEVYVAGFDWIADPQPGCNCNDKNDFLVRAVDAATGAIGWEARYDGPTSGDEAPTGVAVSPDGTKVYVTGSSTDQFTDSASLLVTEIPRDYATVAYNAVPPQAPGDPELGAELWATRFDQTGLYDDPIGGIAVSPDGSLVFVTGSSVSGKNHRAGQTGPTDQVDWATVAYNAATGAQVWQQSYGEDVDNWNNARGLAVSPDGKRLYVAGSVGSPWRLLSGKWGVVAYDSGTGAQAWAEAYRPSVVNDPNGSSWASGVDVSPDGETVYVMGESTGTESSGDLGSSRLTTVAHRSSSGSRQWTAQYAPSSGAFRSATMNSMCCSGNPNKHIVASQSGVYVTGEVRNIKHVRVCCGLIGVGNKWDFALLAYDAGD